MSFHNIRWQSSPLTDPGRNSPPAALGPATRCACNQCQSANLDEVVGLGIFLACSLVSSFDKACWMWTEKHETPSFISSTHTNMFLKTVDSPAAPFRVVNGIWFCYKGFEWAGDCWRWHLISIVENYSFHMWGHVGATTIEWSRIWNSRVVKELFHVLDHSNMSFIYFTSIWSSCLRLLKLQYSPFYWCTDDIYYPKCIWGKGQIEWITG